MQTIRPKIPVPFAYAPCYCEENIWHLLQRQEPGAGARYAVVVSNARRTVAMGQQRSMPEGQLAVWDYHVFMLQEAQEWRVWDLDSRLPLPESACAYLDASFPRDVDAEHAPSFRVIPAHQYVQGLSSDRSHMRTPDGGWTQPEPPWPPIQNGRTRMNLWELVDMRPGGMGSVHSMSGLRAWLGCPPLQGDLQQRP